MNSYNHRPSSAFALTPPIACPACKSPTISTTSRKPDENTYWRCGTCGEVWNPGRREPSPNAAHAWR
jgi:ribosomal protein L37AE/L43A